MRTHRVDSTERTVKDLVKMLSLIKKLSVFNDWTIPRSGILLVVHRWKKEIYGVK